MRPFDCDPAVVVTPQGAEIIVLKIIRSVNTH